MAQADSGFYQGGAVLVGATLASIIATPEQKGTALAAVVTAMRNVMRISYDNMSDKDLLYDHIMVNIEVRAQRTHRLCNRMPAPYCCHNRHWTRCNFPFPMQCLVPLFFFSEGGVWEGNERAPKEMV